LRGDEAAIHGNAQDVLLDPVKCASKGGGFLSVNAPAHLATGDGEDPEVFLVTPLLFGSVEGQDAGITADDTAINEPERGRILLARDLYPDRREVNWSSHCRVSNIHHSQIEGKQAGLAANTENPPSLNIIEGNNDSLEKDIEPRDA